MDETNFKLPIEWIDRIFSRLNDIYGRRFLLKFNDPVICELERMRWQTALYGCNAEEIKKTLELCRAGQIKDPPHAIEFFHYCKGHKIGIPVVAKNTMTQPKKEIAEQYLKLIREKFHGRASSNWEDSLSALNQQVLHNTKKKVSAHWQND